LSSFPAGGFGNVLLFSTMHFFAFLQRAEAVFGEFHLNFSAVHNSAVFGELVRGIYLASDPVSFASEPLLLADGAQHQSHQSHQSIQSLEYFTPE